MLRILLSFCLFSTFLFAGKHDHPSFEELKKQFPNEKGIYIQKFEHLHLNLKKGEINAHLENTNEFMILKDEGSVFADESIHYSKFKTIENIKAFTYVPGGFFSKYKKIKVESFETKDVFSSGVFFDDAKKIEFSFPRAEKQNKTFLSYREVIEDPKFLGTYFFIAGVPTLKSEYKVTFHKDIKIGYKIFNNENTDISFTEDKKGNFITYSWKIDNTKAFRSVGSGPEISYYAPHIGIRILDYKYKGETTKVLPDVNALYNWYYDLVKDINQEPNQVLKDIVDSLSYETKGRDELAKKIFYWVQDNIKYVAFEDGMGGFVPREAGAVCSKRYGDCKDMSSIITEMLSYAGIDGFLTWVGSRDRPYRYDEFPTPIVDNHMIASYLNDAGEIVFLDAVGTYTPYGFPTSFIQGKQSLIGLGARDSFMLKEVPVISGDKNQQTDSVFINIESNKLIVGSGTLHAKGYSKLNLVYRLLNKNNKKRKNTLESMLEKGSNKFLIDSASYSGLENRDDDVKINYTFNLEDYFSVSGNEMYINLHLDKDLKSDKMDIEKRKGVPLEIDHLVKDLDYVILNIPEDYKVTYLPKNASFSNDLFGYEITYKEVNNTITMNKKLYINQLLIDEINFEDWNLMIKQLNENYRESIVLTKLKS